MIPYNTNIKKYIKENHKINNDGDLKMIILTINSTKCSILEACAILNTYKNIIKNSEIKSIIDKKESNYNYISSDIISDKLNSYIYYNTVNNTVNNIDNYNPSVCIIFHLFNKTLLNEFVTYINTVLDFFENVSLVITMHNTVTNKYFSKHILEKIFKNAKILIIENKGVDVGGLFHSMYYIRQNDLKFDYILKIHTKTSDETWRKELIQPLVNKDNLKIIKILFLINNIGFISSDCRIVQNDNMVYWNTNKIGLETFCSIYNIPNGANFKYFIGGTMFWIKYDILNKLSNNMMNYLYSGFSYIKPDPNHISNKIHNEYITERILTGTLCDNCLNIKINKNYFDIIN